MEITSWSNDNVVYTRAFDDHGNLTRVRSSFGQEFKFGGYQAPGEPTQVEFDNPFGKFSMTRTGKQQWRTADGDMWFGDVKTTPKGQSIYTEPSGFQTVAEPTGSFVEHYHGVTERITPTGQFSMRFDSNHSDASRPFQMSSEMRINHKTGHTDSVNIATPGTTVALEQADGRALSFKTQGPVGAMADGIVIYADGKPDPNDKRPHDPNGDVIGLTPEIRKEIAEFIVRRTIGSRKHYARSFTDSSGSIS